jgi:hypothetical protein
MENRRSVKKIKWNKKSKISKKTNSSWQVSWIANSSEISTAGTKEDGTLQSKEKWVGISKICTLLFI